jgi:hypothetical protein
VIDFGNCSLGTLVAYNQLVRTTARGTNTHHLKTFLNP